MQILKEYIDGDYRVVEYSLDGITISHSIRTYIKKNQNDLNLEPIETQPTLEQIAEENLLETKYQTLLLEMML